MMWLLKCTKHLLLIPAIMVLSACQSPAPSLQNGIAYFSLADFISGETTRLSATPRTIYKVGIIGDSTQRDTVQVAAGDTLHWQRSLSIFAESDISKAALKGRYNVDSFFTIDPLSGLENFHTRYTATEANLTTKSVEVIQQGKKVIQLIVMLESDNVIYESEKSLYYYPDSGFTIVATQQVMGGGQENFKITNHWQLH